jgi:hypothetical protein
MTQPSADPTVPDDPPTASEHAAATGGGREHPRSAAESGEQWAAVDELLEGQPTALGE